MKVFYKSKRFWISLFFGLAIIWYMFHKSNIYLIYGNLRDLSISWASVSFICSVLSYVCIAGVLYSLVVASGHYLKLRDIFNISLISTVANYALHAAGLSGLAIKIYLMLKKNIPPSKTLSISIVHGFFTVAIAKFFIVVGIVVFYTHYTIEAARKGSVQWTIALLGSGLFITFVWVGLFIISRTIRHATWKAIMFIYDPLSRKISWLARKKNQLETAFSSFDESITLIVKDSKRLFQASVYAIADWILMFECLRTSFLAVHSNVDLDVLVIGFCVSLFIASISIIPGGVGLMEGSMVSVFYYFGVQYEKALIAVILYRIFYYFIPFVTGTVIFILNFYSPLEQIAGEVDQFSHKS
ncbi:MAG: flippase-like domain-containing protein [Syntrophobacterales bacterium]|nr:flippase-like domain-containing protein [Syntrophobacterales bacterium]